MNNEILRGVPLYLIAQRRYLPFPEAGNMYPRLMNVRVAEDVSNLSVSEVRIMPLDTVAIFTVDQDRPYRMQIVKAESIPYIVSLRIISAEDSRYRFEAHLRRPRQFLSLMRDFNAPFADQLPRRTLAVAFDLTAKVEERHYPPMRAKLFLPWAMKVLEPYNPTHVLAEWEPDSDNHATFYEALAESQDPMQAIEATWTHRQYTQLGFKLMQGVSILDAAESSGGLIKKVSPSGHPATVVRALYRI